ncbi:helix-turn-helix domain-containing protein [Dactylosporangium sp. NBC_01737]|uniref:IclR family transcriptional regulator n=1 Tax=Dactylosporangium sp. NBC_01737 TaxID=2975959 RepID=UPI002E0F850A|nr:helix-turn-helix domain-containing protein [Dactylosporangium sp. NBC_01737]
MAVKTIDVVSRALAVLEQVSLHQPASLGALARELDLDKSAVQRIVATLHADGWIRPDAAGQGGWTLTGRALAVGGRFAAGEDLRARARRVLREVHAATGETVWLAVADGGSLIVVDEIASTHVLRVTFPIGYTGPFGPDTAGGVAILAQEAHDAPGHGGAASHDGAAGLSPEARTRLAKAHLDGFAVQMAGEVPLWAAAVALPREPGALPAAVVIGVPQSRGGEPELRRLGAVLAEAVRAAYAGA